MPEDYTPMFYRIKGNQDCIHHAQPQRRTLWARFIYWLAGDIDTTELAEYYRFLDSKADAADRAWHE